MLHKMRCGERRGLDSFACETIEPLLCGRVKIWLDFGNWRNFDDYY